jgi:hypothetical protein
MSDTTNKVMALVNIESAWASKINWTAAIGAVAALVTILSGNHYQMDAGTQASIVTGIILLQSLLTMIFRTRYTTTVTQSSVDSTPVGVPPIQQSIVPATGAGK